jgi:hypothetical protein
MIIVWRLLLIENLVQLNELLDEQMNVNVLSVSLPASDAAFGAT